MNSSEIHAKKVDQLQLKLKNLRHAHVSSFPIALHYSKGHSNTTRSKAYKQHCAALDFSNLNEVIHIDSKNRIALVEPRVTMEALLQATLPFQLVPFILPECRGITVGGAIMGGAGESSSHRWGCFNDICPAYEMLCGDGERLIVSPQENQDIYYGIASSYGSLGALVSAEIQLLPVEDFIYLRYHFFSNALEALEKMNELIFSSNAPDFIDGIIFDKKLTIVMEGHLQPNDKLLRQAPLFSMQSPFSNWFYQHVKKKSLDKQNNTEKMSLEDYFFRYDLGGFWMGAYLFQIPFLKKFISEGIWHLEEPMKDSFSQSEIEQFHHIPDPPILGRTFMRPFLNMKKLWTLLHKAETWIQRRMVIQDFCIPQNHALAFCEKILDTPAIFPIWLCPLKGTRTSQIFSPHFLSENQLDTHLINFGIYGIPAHANSIRSITKNLEIAAHTYGGRKALYSHSYYTCKEFWQIYSRHLYENLRSKTKAIGVWHEITDKVLSD